MLKLRDTLVRGKERFIEAYDRAPEIILLITEPLIKWARVLIYFLGELKVDAFLLQGESKDGIQHKVLYVGSSTGLDPAKKFLGHRKNHTIARRNLYLWQIKNFLNTPHHEADCVVFYASTLLYRFLKPKDYFRVLPSVKSFLDLSGSRGETEGKFHPSAKRKIRKVQAKNFAVRLLHGDKGLSLFYYEMYVPYIRKRFGEDAVLDSLYKVKRLLRTGFLLIIQKGDKWLSGAVCRIRNKIFTFELAGVYQGDIQYVMDGAHDALYLHFLNLAQENKCRGIDLGISPPFLKNGLLRYKNKWGAILLENQKEIHEICIRINRPERLRFLYQYPILKDSGGLSGLIYTGNECSDASDLSRRLEKIYTNSGLRSLCLYTPTGLARIDLTQ